MVADFKAYVGNRGHMDPEKSYTNYILLKRAMRQWILDNSMAAARVQVCGWAHDHECNDMH
jgi:hypothetical protein